MDKNNQTAAYSIRYIVTANVNMESSKHFFLCCACCFVVQVFQENSVPFYFAGGTMHAVFPPHCLQHLSVSTAECLSMDYGGMRQHNVMPRLDFSRLDRLQCMQYYSTGIFTESRIQVE